MNVSAIIVTRGGQDLTPIWESLPKEWERVCWDNSGFVTAWLPHGLSEQTGHVIAHEKVSDFSVYGRYAAIEFASHDLVYVQDDDCIVSDPQAIVDAWVGRWQDMQPDDEGSLHDHSMGPEEAPFLVANMPPEFRHDGYTDSCLVGFGACFHRDAPARAFERLTAPAREYLWVPDPHAYVNDPWFQRTCDLAFTTLTSRVLVAVPKTDREFASDPGRMWRTPGHVEERARMLALARQVRDG